MTFNPLSVSAETYPDEEFYAVIDNLKRQNALPQDSFIRDIPFFTLAAISKESQIKELFENSYDPNQYKALLQNIISLPQEAQGAQDGRLPATKIMTFAQLCLYKVLPCPDLNCPNRPREIVTHNQYKDFEYECPFYHHDRDRRRIVITDSADAEFAYKANYYEEGRSHDEREKYSQNYFESMFHPLYYKMFKCKREYCNSVCQFCPFFHQEQEKKSWDKTFSSFIRKDRITYVKDKQKYYESTSHAAEVREQKSSGDYSPNKAYNQDDRRRPQRNNRNNRYQKSPNSPNTPNTPNTPIQNRNTNMEGGFGKNKQFSNQKRGDWNNNSGAWRKNSNDSSNSLEMLENTKQFVPYRAC